MPQKCPQTRIDFNITVNLGWLPWLINILISGLRSASLGCELTSTHPISRSAWAFEFWALRPARAVRLRKHVTWSKHISTYHQLHWIRALNWREAQTHGPRDNTVVLSQVLYQIQLNRVILQFLPVSDPDRSLPLHDAAYVNQAVFIFGIRASVFRSCMIYFDQYPIIKIRCHNRNRIYIVVGFIFLG